MNWLRAKWKKFKAWFIALLISIGLIAAPLLYAAPKDFSWQNPTTRVDATPFDSATEQAQVNIYCDGDTVPTVSFPNGSTAGTFDFTIGTHTCYATVVDTDNQESDPSNTVAFEITPARPSPPTLSVN